MTEPNAVLKSPHSMTLADKAYKGTRRRLQHENKRAASPNNRGMNHHQRLPLESNLEESPRLITDGTSQNRNGCDRRNRRRQSIYVLRYQWLLLLSILLACLYFSSISFRQVVPSSSASEDEYSVPATRGGKGLSHQDRPKRNFTHNDLDLRSELDQARPRHRIPDILIFTHYRDLIHESSNLVDEEERVLSANIRHSIDIHKPNTAVRFLTDDDCIQSLQRVFPSLIPFFQNETQGMFKADICRGSALYETGGIYLDVDVGVRKNLWLDLLPQTEFVTSLVHGQSKWPRHFFQAILGAAPKSPILYNYLQLFLDHYTGKDRVKKGPLGVILLRRAWDAVYNKETDSPATELYQEVLYHKQLFPHLKPAPTWGARRACHFVVVAKAHFSKNVEMTHEGGKQYHIPLYSRVGGSRMCPIKNHTKSLTA